MIDSRQREHVREELAKVLGEGKLLWKKSDIVPYTKDTYRLRFDEDYKYFPDFVVLPETTAEVQSIVTVASKHSIPIIPKGGGSCRTGMLVPIHGGMVVDTIKMTRVLEVSVADNYVTCQPGITLLELEKHLQDFGLALNQEQGSFRVATVGGSIATSGFSRKHQKYGTIADRVMSLEVVLADGRILRTGPKVLYTSTGYRLHELFIGSEGTLGIITEATLRVEPLPEAKDCLLAFYDDFWGANEAAQKLMRSPVTFTGGEAFEVESVVHYGGPEGKRGVFYLGFEGIKGEVESEVSYVRGLIAKTGGVLAKHDDAVRFMERYIFQWCGARALTGFEDPITAVVPMEKIREFFDKFNGEILPKYDTGPLPNEVYSLDVGKYKIVAGRYWIPKGEGGWEKWQGLLRELATLVTGLGGSISTCHGVGLEHRDNLDLEYSEVALDTMRAVKKALDPQNLMNPAKKIPDKK